MLIKWGMSRLFKNVCRAHVQLILTILRSWQRYRIQLFCTTVSLYFQKCHLSQEISTVPFWTEKLQSKQLQGPKRENSFTWICRTVYVSTFFCLFTKILWKQNIYRTFIFVSICLPLELFKKSLVHLNYLICTSGPPFSIKVDLIYNAKRHKFFQKFISKLKEELIQ